MRFVKDFIRRLFGNTGGYKFLVYLIGGYRDHRRMIYAPEDFAVFEEGAFVEPGAEIYHRQRVVLRKCAVILKGALINAEGGLHVGRYSGISYNCTIFTGEHRFLKSEALPFDKRNDLKPVFIDDCVFIGANVCIMPGVRIGTGAVVGMGTVVMKDIPELAIVVGNPAQVIGYRDKKHFEDLKAKGAFQSPRVAEYIDHMPLMYRKKYKNFLPEIGLSEVGQKHDPGA